MATPLQNVTHGRIRRGAFSAARTRARLPLSEISPSPIGLRTIIRNALSGYGFQALSYGVALTTVPYLARTLGSEGYGRFVIATAVGTMIGQGIGYGFDISVTREVAQGPAERPRLARYAADVLTARAVVAGPLFVFVLLASPWIPGLRDSRVLLLGALVLGLSRILGTVWYFHGLERHHHLNAILAAGRVVYAAGLFLLIREPGDVSIAVCLVAGEALLGGLVSHGMILVECGFALPHLGEVRRLLRESIYLFWVRITAVVVAQAGALIVGLVISEAAAGWYGAAERLAHALRAAVLPAATALYPRFAKLVDADAAEADRLERLSLLSALIFGVASFLAVFSLAPWIIAFLYGPEFTESVLVLRIGALWPLIYALAWHVTLRVFARQRYREFAWAVALSSAAYLPAAFFLAHQLEHIGVAIASTLAQVMSGLLIYRIYRKPWPGANDRDLSTFR